MMSESRAHIKAKTKAAGKKGDTEVRIKGNRRLDAATKKTAIEIERSGNPKQLKKAVERLKDSGKPQKVLQVPQHYMPKAAKAMKAENVSGTVKNMSGTKRRHVSKS